MHSTFHSLSSIEAMHLALGSRLLFRVPVALWHIAGLGARRRASPARILMFHGTPRRQARELESQLRYLARNFEIRKLDEVSEGKAGAISLTFDDGLRNNVAVAYPILKRLGLPATFFVCPKLVDERRWLWTHEMRARLNRLGVKPEAVESLMTRIKAMDPDTRAAVERRIEDETPDFAPTPEEREEYELASWEELRALDPELVAIGSHTMTHPVLSTLTHEQAELEIRDSRAVLERRLGRKVELFCYPNGAAGGNVLALARATYRVAVTTAPGAVRPGTDPLLLPRLAAPRGLLRLAWQVRS
jgi:peptidoglycan/xylan/chitin deacetylase (PgdA/CDA1 family)